MGKRKACLEREEPLFTGQAICGETSKNVRKFASNLGFRYAFVSISLITKRRFVVWSGSRERL